MSIFVEELSRETVNDSNIRPRSIGVVLHSSTLRNFVEKQPNLSAEFRVYRGNELRVREVLEDVAQANREASANRGQETIVVDFNFQG